MKKSDLLPIGSVIITKDSDKKVVIVGTRLKNDDGKYYDYGCVEYPYGFTKEKSFIYVNKEDIKGLCFLGDVNRKRGD